MAADQPPIGLVGVVTRLRRRLRLGFAARRSSHTRFDAFVSYSHAADSDFAPVLQRGLHAFARPWFRRRAMRVFRDVSSLSATAGLMSTIEDVLRQSRFLILLASPTAAKSPWVEREVKFWCENKSAETLLIVVTDGDVAWNDTAKDFDWDKTSALPPILARRYAEEPLLVDVRWAKDFDRLGPRHPLLREVTATLAATIHGRARDSLIGEDIRRHRRAIQVAILAGAMIVGFAGVASWQSVLARQERDNALKQTRQARSLALSASSGLQLEEHPKTALMLGLEAYRLHPRAEARSALISALQVSTRTGAGPVLRGHTDIARAAAFTPDGKKLVSVGDDHLVRVWDTARGREVGGSPLHGHKDLVMAVDVSPDGRVVASGSWDGTVRLWDLADAPGEGTGKVLRHGDRVESVAFSSQQNLLAVASGAAVEIWAYRERRKLATLPAAEDVDKVAFSPEGRLVAAATGTSGDVLIWDLSTGKGWSVHHGGIAGAVSFSADGRFLAIGGSGEDTHLGAGTVSFWDAQTHRVTGRTIRTGTDLVRGIVLARDARTLFAAGQNGEVARIDIKRERVLGHLPDVSEGQGIWGLAASRDRRVLAIPVSDGSVRMWKTDRTRGFGSRLRGSAGKITAIAVSPHGELVAAARVRGTAENPGGSIDVWDASEQRLVQTLDHLVSAIAFDPSGKAVVFADEGHVRVWYPHSGAVVTMRGGRIPSVMSIAVSRDGQMIATGEFDGRVRLWDVRARRQVGKPIETPKTSPREVSFVAFGPDGKSVAFAAGDYQRQSVRLVDIETRRIRDSIGGIWPLNSGVVSPKGTVRAASINNPHVTLVTVNPTSVRRIRVGAASAAALSPDGATLLVGGENGLVRAWDPDGLTPMGSAFAREPSDVTELAFSADGRTFAAAGENGRVRVWQHVFWKDLPEIEKRVCRDAGSSIPREEWASVAPGIPYHASCG